jgi:hypothetical protein
VKQDMCGKLLKIFYQPVASVRNFVHSANEDAEVEDAKLRLRLMVVWGQIGGKAF